MKFLTTREAACRFRRSRKTIYRWIREGRPFDLENIIKVRDGYLIPESEVDRVLKANKFDYS